MNDKSQNQQGLVNHSESKAKVVPVFRMAALGVVLSAFSAPVAAQWLKEDRADSFEQALQEARVGIDFRLRYEDAEQGNKGGQALTLRSRFSFETLPYELFHAYLEVDDVRAIPDDTHYFSGSNGETDDLFIEDPQGTQINQIWLAYDVANTLIKYGRQALSLNNERLLGTDAWRQQAQSFSAFSFSNESLNYLRFEFAQINQVLGNQAPGSSAAQQDVTGRMLNINYRGFWLNDLSLYALWISDHPAQRQWESASYGIRFAGDFGGNAFNEWSLAFELEMARQEDAGSNPENYQADYRLLDLTLGYRGFSITAGFEHLGADDQAFFVTPMGSLSSFQGASAIFENDGLGNIPGGINDRYLAVAYRYERNAQACHYALTWSAAFHDYRADTDFGGINAYGDEWILQGTYEAATYDVFLQYADYRADQFARDKQTIRLGMGLRF